LAEFFQAQARCGPKAFAHFDIQHSWLAPLGAWLFHYARMRLPLAQHDGTLSAIRAHPQEMLLDSAIQGAGADYRWIHFNRRIAWMPLIRTMHAVMGVETGLASALELDGRFVWVGP
ncbi:MAG: methyltransferase type 11, partial [Myxococcota bacterium]